MTHVMDFQKIFERKKVYKSFMITEILLEASYEQRKLLQRAYQESLLSKTQT